MEYCKKTCQYYKDNKCCYNGSDWMECEYALLTQSNRIKKIN